MKNAGSERLKNPKWELFCWLYSGYHNRNLFGNASQCYMQAFNFNDQVVANEKEIDDLMAKKAKGYTVRVAQLEAKNKSLNHVARNESSKLMAKRGVGKRCDYLMDSMISDDHSDRELQYTILQRFDLNSKVQAIKEYNRVKDRGAAGRLEGSFVFSWEGEGEKPAKKPIIKKATIKKEGAVDWEES